MGWLIRIGLLLLLVALVVRALWRFLGGVVDGASGRGRSARSLPRQPLVRDPVCGTYVVQARALAVTRGDTTEYFCSERCRRAYIAGR